MTYKFSPSSLSLLDDCPRCFWLQFNRKIKRPQNGMFPSLPSGMDKIIKVHFDSFRDKDMLPPEISGLGGIKLFDNVKLLDVWRNNYKGIEWMDSEGNVLKGAVDNILVKGTKLIVLDYKTRGYDLKDDTHEHYQDQLDIYNFLLRKNGYETEDYSLLLFFHPNKVNENGDIIFHKTLKEMKISVENAERIFKNAIKILKGGMPKSSDDCEFCMWAEKTYSK